MSGPPVEVVLFDLGGVVCDFRPARRLAALAAASGLPDAEIHGRIWESGLEAECEAGGYTAAEAHRAIASELGAMSHETLASLWTVAFEPRPDVLAVVDRVRMRRRVGLLTDNGPILREALPKAFPEVARRFTWLFFSCDLKATKPAPEVFARVVERVGVPAERILLIDDAPTNVDGARAAGLQALRYTTVPALVEDLRVALP